MIIKERQRGREREKEREKKEERYARVKRKRVKKELITEFRIVYFNKFKMTRSKLFLSHQESYSQINFGNS